MIVQKPLGQEAQECHRGVQISGANGAPGMHSDFPQYRRSAHGTNYYRIDAADRFEELQLIGSKVLRHTVEARAYPERVRVMDMLCGSDGAYLPVSVKEYEAVAARSAG